MFWCLYLETWTWAKMYRPQPHNFKCSSGYVVQDDLIKDTMTMWTSGSRLSYVSPARCQRGRHLIEVLGLTTVAYSKVGSQMKRGSRVGKGRGLAWSSSRTPRFSSWTNPPQPWTPARPTLCCRLSVLCLVSGQMVFHWPAPNALDYFSNIGYACEPGMPVNKGSANVPFMCVTCVGQ